jgi:general secretion pathway protein L
MSTLSDIGTAFSFWIDAVARTVEAAFERFRSTRRIDVVENDDGTFTIRMAQGTPAGEMPPAQQVRIAEGAVSGLLPEWAKALRDSRVELVLRPSRFLFRPLDLPTRASEFLDGIIRAQIDRLTPWSANDAVYHWSTPTESTGGRITMTIVATARAMVTPLAQAVAGLGAAIVEVSTLMPGPDAVPVRVYSERNRTRSELGRIRMVLLSVFVATGFAAVASIGAAGFVADYYDSQRQQIQRKIAERRAAVRAGQAGAGNSALELLERRKRTTPSSVMVIEALSELLPDHTYTIELRIEGERLQVIGITRDAPSLIRLLEQSPHFTRATFFAPTTRAPNNPGERFHIEARIRPHFGSGT